MADEVTDGLHDAAAACKKLLEVSPYECLCGTGVMRQCDCPWHQALYAAARELYDVGYGPDWYSKEKDDGIDDAVPAKVEPAEPAKAPSPGDVGSLPNCS